MNDLLPRLHKAKTNNGELGELIRDYMPFIKKESIKAPAFQMEPDDRLSIAMLVFMNCVRLYDENAGAFLPFAAACIRNRLIDEERKLARHAARVRVFLDDESSGKTLVEERIASLGYEKEQERMMLAEEIDSLAHALAGFDTSLEALHKTCPKQRRSRRQCVAIAREMMHDPVLKERFFTSHRIPQSELARRFQLSEKTVEKHRRYIVAIALLLSGEYPGIQAFLPKGGDIQ